jgi:hypothetical protein
MSVSIIAEFVPTDRVYIDGCLDLVAVVTAVFWRHPEVVNYEVSWIANGKSEMAMIEGWRLTRTENVK